MVKVLTMVGAARSGIGFAQETVGWRLLSTMHRVHDVYVNVNANPPHCLHESTRTPDPLPARRRAPRRGRLPLKSHLECAGSAWAYPLRWITFICGCCADRQPDADGALVDGWTIVDCRIDSAATRAQWEQICELPGQSARPSGHRDPHASRPYRAGTLASERWNVRLWISATDYNVARLAVYDPQGFGGGSGGRFLRVARCARPVFSGPCARSCIVLSNLGPRIARPLSPPHGWRHP